MSIHTETTPLERSEVKRIERLDALKRLVAVIEEAGPSLPPISNFCTISFDLEGDVADGEEARVRCLRQFAQNIKGLGGFKKSGDAASEYLQVSAAPLEDEPYFKLTATLWGVCKRVETGAVEEYEVTEVPDEIAEKHTTIKTRPVTKKVCPPLMSNQAWEAV